jgi:hypothetical protein
MSNSKKSDGYVAQPGRAAVVAGGERLARTGGPPLIGGHRRGELYATI